MKRILSFLLFTSLFLSLSAQKRDIPLKEYFADAEYFLVQEEYTDALSDYLEVYNRGYENNANINYCIGICYLNIPGQKAKSIQYLEKASLMASLKYRESSLNELYAPLDVFLYLGNAYRIDYQLDTAAVRYRHYLELISDKSVEEKEYVEKQIEACYIAKEFVISPKKVIFNNLGKIINTNNSNYNAVISGDGNTMVFMNKLPFYEAVMMSKKRGNNWGRPINITPQIMSDGDQKVTGISFDGKTILLEKYDAFNSDIYTSEYKDGQWAKSKPVKSLNTKYWESHASFSADGKTIYFTSNRKGGLGGMDIYKSEQNDEGDWGAAKNLGIGVNTVLNEDTPFISADGTKLFYSSQGHRNIGGYDYFFSEYADTAWINPQNLQYPLSTTDEDLFYFPIGNGETALVHRILEDGYGVYDIYSVEFPTEEEIEESIAEQVSMDVDEELAHDTAEVKEEPITIELTPILFAFDKSALSAEIKTQLNILIKILKSNPEARIKIVGYTDALGPETYNMFLSERRAKEVAKYFIEKGISSDKVEPIGRGETNFVAPNTTSSGGDNPEGRKYNRRVEFELLGLDAEWYIIKKISNVPKEMQVQKK